MTVERSPGVVRCVAALSRSDLRRAVADGQRVIVVDARRARGKMALMDTLAEALELPPWFGRNWDALADVLPDVIERYGPTTLVIRRAAHLGADEPAAGIVDELADIVAGQPGLTLVLVSRPPLSVGSTR